MFGPEGPLADAEILAMIVRFLEEVGLAGTLTLEINSLGCPECRPAYREKLIAALEAKEPELCGNCQNRLHRNPLRVLDCKNESCKEIAHDAPHMLDHLCETCDSHFTGLKSHLDTLGLKYVVNPMMVRGLDYYTRTAFEVTTDALGAQSAVAAGGRYDGLVTEMGGKNPVPAIGFAMGLERLALLLEQQEIGAAPVDIYLAAVGDEAAQSFGLKAAEAFRAAGLRVAMGLQGGSMKAQMKKAGKSGARYSVVIGEEEAQNAQVTLKDMEQREQWTLSIEEAVARMKSA
ncbi:putative histidyl-tRNA synthetase [Magnetofaba australis IT-1]|uniref:Histidine--tRNA ligase n=2 Tax=Magnetofaba TaxID=1472292 RepID=A0A1Y2K787_9PROT|nr:putative histidyl-tRNA synthetase [Magnetofaba australis IT-1]